jgi:hypothetical protein
VKSSATLLLIGALVALVALTITGCAAPAVTVSAVGDAELAAILVTDNEAGSAGWTAADDEGPVDGSTTDCTGAPFDWPDLETVAFPSQFLNRPDESVALVVKHLDGDTAANVEALRQALAPCAPSSGGLLHGAMITPVGDDSFAYQSLASDDQGDYVLSNMLIACGNLSLEVLSISYSNQLDQSELEDVVAPAVDRLLEAGGCL